MQKTARIVILVLLFLYLFTLVHRGIFDLDIWLHLKAGEWILQNQAIPQNDIFSFTIQGKPWIDHSWLFQIFVYLIYNSWGDGGLILFETIIVYLAFLFLFFSFYRKPKDYYIVAITVFFTMSACLVRFNIRPDILSLLFFSIYLFVLRRPLTRKAFYGLLFIQLLWVNIHGYFFLGPLLVFIMVIQEIIRRRFKNRLPWQWNEANIIGPEKYSKLKRLLIAVIAINFLNPQFIKGALYPLWVFKDSLLGKNKIFFADIVELRSVFDDSFAGKRYYIMLMIFSALGLVLNRKKLKFHEALSWLIFVPFSFVLRNIVYFIFIAAHIICSNADALCRLPSIFFVRMREFSWLKGVSYVLKWCVVILFAFYLGYLTQKRLFISYFDFNEYKFKSALLGTLEYKYPKEAVDFVIREKLPKRMLNDFNSGAYLIGRTFPQRRVFIDGRTEVYGEKFYTDLKKVFGGNKKAIEKTLEEYDITAVFLSYITGKPAKKFIEYLYTSPEWKIVYLDNFAMIFLKDVPANKGLIQRLQIDFDNWDVPAFPFDEVAKYVYPKPYVKRAEALDILKEDKAVLNEVNQALRIMPNCALALNFKGKVFMRRQQFKEALVNLRAAYINFPQNPDIVYNLGRAYKNLKEYEKAIDAFEYALKIKPNSIAIHKEMASVYKEKGDLTNARKTLEKAHRIKPKNEEINSLLDTMIAK